MLVDTGALLALTLKGDQHHARAAAFARRNPDARFVLTDLVLAETVTRLRARAGARLAARAGRSLLDSHRYEVLFVDPPLVSSGLARLELPAAFAFDRDFRDCGYRTVP